MTHQYMPKIFHDPHKNNPAPPPTYLMYGSLLLSKLHQVQGISKLDQTILLWQRL